MHFKQETVQLESIDLDDEQYCITTEANINNLIASIKHIGLINSPLLIKSKKTKFIIVCGFCRVKACKQLGLSDISAKIVPANADKFECIKLAIADNTFQRNLNLIEQSKALDKLSLFFKNEKSLSKAAAKIGLPSNSAIIKKIKSLCRLPSQIQNYIISDIISLSTATELIALESDTALTLANLFNYLKLSLNKQKEMLTFVKEIALRENISIIKVIQSNYFQEILQNDNLDRTQKTQKIRFYLKQRRFPAITKAKEKFERNIKQLKFGNNVKLIPPNNFEGSFYTLKLNFSSLKELQNHTTTIDKIIHSTLLE